MATKVVVLPDHLEFGLFPSRGCSENETDRQVVAAVEAWKHADFLCRNYLLNGLDNMLYNVYCAFNIAREL